MATVERRQQGGGPIRYRVRWRDPSGKQKSRTFDRRRDADQWRTHVEHQVLSGAYVDPAAGKITLRSYAEQWRASRPWAPTTAEWVEEKFRLHLYPVLGDRPIGSIRTSDVQGWVKGLALSPTSARNTASKLSSVMRAAVADRLIALNPCEGVALPKAVKRLVVPPTAEQVGELAVAMPDDWRVIVALGSGLGLRAGEALGLTVDRVDFLRREVRVDRQMRRVKGEGSAFAPPKTEASVRSLPLPDSVGNAISAHIASQGTGHDGLLIHSTTGRPQSSQRLSDVMAAACARAGIEPIRFHDLRHFYASMLIAGGASVKTVQARLGHATAAETMDTYGHLWPDNEEQTRSTVDDVLGSVTYRWPEVSGG